VLFFGDIRSASVASIGLNPSDQEYLDRNGLELDGGDRRFESLDSLGAKERPHLTDAQCATALDTMRQYYEPGKPVYRWFRPLEQFMIGFGGSYANGDVIHLDLVQEATSPTWSSLKKEFPEEAEGLLTSDLPFLKYQLSSLNPEAVICNGKTVTLKLGTLFRIDRRDEGKVERLKWFAGIIHLPERPTPVVGWNYPLQKATGLTYKGLRKLGLALKQYTSS